MIQIAQIGCGYWGRNLLRNLANLPGCRLAAVVDPSPSARDLLRKDYPNVAHHDDPLPVFEDRQIQAVVIATPAETHFGLSRQALESGKDVFVEKPLALNVDDGASLVHIAEDHNRILMVGHVLEYHPAIVRLNEFVVSGELGKVRYIYSNRLSLGKVRREENILWSFAPHDIAVILRLLGAMPFQVVACGGSYVQPNIADVTVTNLLFDNGVRAHIYVSWLHPFKEQRLVVIGSKKMVSFDDVAKQLVLYDQRVEVREGEPMPVRGSGQSIPFSADEPLRLECEAFVESIKTRYPPLTDGRSGLKVLEVLQAAQKSLVMNGDAVQVPSMTG